MELTVPQTDALTALVNIGYAHSAAALSELTDHRISLEVPGVAVLPILEINERFQGVVAGEVISVHEKYQYDHNVTR